MSERLRNVTVTIEVETSHRDTRVAFTLEETETLDELKQAVREAIDRMTDLD